MPRKPAPKIQGNPCGRGHSGLRRLKKNGKPGDCVECAAASNASHYAANLEKVTARAAAWSRANPEKVREIKRKSSRKRYAANPERFCERSRKYYWVNPEKEREQARNYERKRNGAPEPLWPCPDLCEARCSREAVCLDHDHETGAFRGWLCHQCNRYLGLLGDDIAAVDRLLRYLLRYSYFSWMEDGGSLTLDPAQPFKRNGHKKPIPHHPMPELCEACGGPPNGLHKTLGADHCHRLDAPRGWLCSSCNRGLGGFGDDLPGVIRIRDYLLRAAPNRCCASAAAGRRVDYLKG